MPPECPANPDSAEAAHPGDPTPMEFESAEAPDNAPVVAPEGYRPHWLATHAMSDDDLNDAERVNAWRTYFASGANRPHWFLIDAAGEVHMVEMIDLSGSYQSYGPGYSHRFDNAYDAFWTGETLARTFTDAKSPDFQPVA